MPVLAVAVLVRFVMKGSGGILWLLSLRPGRLVMSVAQLFRLAR